MPISDGIGSTDLDTLKMKLRTRRPFGMDGLMNDY